MKRFSACCILSMVLAATASLAQDPVKIGFIFGMSGRMANFGAVAKQGAEVAINEINAAGGIEGRKIVGSFEDSKGDPATAQKAFEKLVTSDRVDVVIGITSDGEALEVAKQANEHGTPLIITGAQIQSVTGSQCNRFTFRLCPSSFQSARLGALLAGRTGAMKWTTVGLDDVASEELWEHFVKSLKQVRPEASFAAKADLGLVSDKTVDAAQVVKTIAESGADGILICLYGGDLIDFVKAGNKSELFDGKRQFVILKGSVSELQSLGIQMPSGVWWSTPYWFQASRTPLNRTFAETYETKYGAPPSWQAQFAYGGVLAYVAAAKKAASTDKQAVIAALEGLQLELPVGTVTIRADDHQAIMHAMAGKTARMGVTARKRPFRALDSMVLFRNKDIAESDAEKACKRRQ